MKIKEETFELTPSQKEVKTKIRKFLKSPDRIFLLTGKPGVGKTTMSKIVLADHIKRDIENNTSGYEINVAGISLSHQAKNVLGEHIPHVFTFAKAYGLKEKRHDDGSRTFEPIETKSGNKPFVIGHCSIPVFIHDEVSQYTPEMLKIVLENTSSFSKIIFMGDKAQLPPIDPDNKMLPDADSPVFELDLPDECKHELTERVRQASNNPILELSDIIREEIFGSQNISRIIDLIKEPRMVDGIGYDFIKYNELNDHIKRQDLMKATVICFRNKAINFFNDSIRNYLLDHPMNNIVVNDIICMTDNFYKEDSLGVSLVFNNSDVFRIKEVISYKEKCHVAGEVYYIDCFKAKTTSNTEGDFICPTANGMVDYNNILNKLSKRCRSYELKWDVFWDFYGHFCRFNYAYAITAYKAQGSTYNTVYVDINDILMTRPLTPKRKLQTIYTAITRAKYDVYFLKS